MEKLICEGNGILINNYLKKNNLYIIDAKFQSKEEFDNFMDLYEKHEFERGIFRFEIGGKCFEGWFGRMMYDLNYNVRFYVGIYNENEKLDRNDGGNAYSIGRSILGLGKAVRALCSILYEKDILSQEQRAKILEMMDTPETMMELRDLMEDLPLYLKSNHATIEDIRNRKY